MLLGDFYTIDSYQAGEGTVEATLVINAGHRIFEGHFPGQPVTPGVCMMQMVQELAEKVTGARLRLLKADDMKFLAVIDPVRNNIVQAKLLYNGDAGRLQVSATLFRDELVHFKFKGSFTDGQVSPSSAG